METIKLHLLYVLPKRLYFGQGHRGRLTHALGVVQGMLAQGARVTVMSGPGACAYFARHPRLRVLEVGGDVAGRRAGIWLLELHRKIDEELRSDRSIDNVLVRYAVSIGCTFVPLIRRFRDHCWCFEVNSLAYNQYAGLPAFLRKSVRQLEARILNEASLVYVVSNALREDLMAAKPGMHGKITVVPNAASSVPRPAVVWSRTTKPQAEPGQSLRLTYLGVFQPYYELDVLAKAFAKLALDGINVELHLFGDGPGRAKVEEITKGLDGVVFHGRYVISDLIATDTLDQHTILMLPNKADGMSRIGSPTKLYEYMSFGCPIVASRVGQAVDVLEDGVSGLFYEPGDPSSCAAAILRLVQDEDLRARLGSAAWSEFTRNHTWESRMGSLARAMTQLSSVGS
jgi:glycosyltransferase involved in cell wall biosynthesis